jgi:hypothetical protein
MVFADWRSRGGAEIALAIRCLIGVAGADDRLAPSDPPVTIANLDDDRIDLWETRRETLYGVMSGMLSR